MASRVWGPDEFLERDAGELPAILLEGGDPALLEQAFERAVQATPAPHVWWEPHMALPDKATVVIRGLEAVPLEEQRRLVNALQEGQLRLVAATAGAALEALLHGKLRDDLYYRFAAGVVSLDG